MIKMKYFRFLYCRTEGCLLHYGELRDTCTGAQYNFLCLKTLQNAVNERREADKPQFCCPVRLDMIVVEEWDSCTAHVLKRILAKTETGRLIYPGQQHFPEEAGSRVKEYVRLSGGDKEKELSFTAAGWNFQIRSCGEGKLMLLHGLEENSLEEPRELWSDTAPKADIPGTCYGDCVMNVKGMDMRQKCMTETFPDGYECALGCVLHRDYDVCNYGRGGRGNPGLTGTLLLPEMTQGELRKTLRDMKRNFRRQVRFFVTEHPARVLQEIKTIQQDDEEFAERSFSERNSREERILPEDRMWIRNRKCYYIGAGEGLTDPAWDSFYGGMYRVPVRLEEGAGLCCSGFLKYGGA